MYVSYWPLPQKGAGGCGEGHRPPPGHSVRSGRRPWKCNRIHHGDYHDHRRSGDPSILSEPPRRPRAERISKEKSQHEWEREHFCFVHSGIFFFSMRCCVCYETVAPREDHFTCGVCREGILCGPCTKDHLVLCWTKTQIGRCPICRTPFPIFYHGQYLSGEVVLSSRDDDNLSEYGEDGVFRDVFTVEMWVALFGTYLSLVFLASVLGGCDGVLCYPGVD